MSEASRFFRGLDVVIEPRKLWPSGLPDRKGKITFLAPGRALAFADDPAWSEELGKLWQTDAPAPPELLAALVDVLRRWSRSWERPVAVVPMPSRRFPIFVRSLAAHLAEVGRLPLVDALAVTGPPPDADAASAVRAKDLLYRTRLEPGVRFDGRSPAGRRHRTEPLDDDGCRRAAGRRRGHLGAAPRGPSPALSPQPPRPLG